MDVREDRIRDLDKFRILAERLESWHCDAITALILAELGHSPSVDTQKIFGEDIVKLSKALSKVFEALGMLDEVAPSNKEILEAEELDKENANASSLSALV